MSGTRSESELSLHEHRGWMCRVESGQWATTYHARSPDGRFELTVDDQQAMGDTTISLSVSCADHGRTTVSLLDPHLPYCALSPRGDRLYLDDRGKRRVYDNASGEELSEVPWPHDPNQVVLLVDLLPSLKQRNDGSAAFGLAPPPNPKEGVNVTELLRPCLPLDRPGARRDEEALRREAEEQARAELTALPGEPLRPLPTSRILSKLRAALEIDIDEAMLIAPDPVVAAGRYTQTARDLLASSGEIVARLDAVATEVGLKVRVALDASDAIHREAADEGEGGQPSARERALQYDEEAFHWITKRKSYTTPLRKLNEARLQLASKCRLAAYYEHIYLRLRSSDGISSSYAQTLAQLVAWQLLPQGPERPDVDARVVRVRAMQGEGAGPTRFASSEHATVVLHGEMLWRLDVDGEVVWALQRSRADCLASDVAIFDGAVYVVWSDGLIEVLDLRDGQGVADWQLPPDALRRDTCTRLAVAPRDSLALVVGYAEHRLSMADANARMLGLDLERREILWSRELVLEHFDGPNAPVIPTADHFYCLTHYPDSTGSTNAYLLTHGRLGDASYEPWHSAELGAYPVQALATLDSTHLVAIVKGDLRLIRVPTRELLEVATESSTRGRNAAAIALDACPPLAVATGTTLVATTTKAGNVAVWNVAQNQLVQVVRLPSGPPTALAFTGRQQLLVGSPDGAQQLELDLASVSASGPIHDTGATTKLDQRTARSRPRAPATPSSPRPPYERALFCLRCCTLLPSGWICDGCGAEYVVDVRRVHRYEKTHGSSAISQAAGDRRVVRGRIVATQGHGAMAVSAIVVVGTEKASNALLVEMRDARSEGFEVACDDGTTVQVPPGAIRVLVGPGGLSGAESAGYADDRGWPTGDWEMLGEWYQTARCPEIRFGRMSGRQIYAFGLYQGDCVELMVPPVGGRWWMRPVTDQQSLRPPLSPYDAARTSWATRLRDVDSIQLSYHRDPGTFQVDAGSHALEGFASLTDLLITAGFPNLRGSNNAVPDERPRTLRVKHGTLEASTILVHRQHHSREIEEILMGLWRSPLVRRDKT